MRTFFSFARSVCSSLPAFAACRLSCFAVNCVERQMLACGSTVVDHDPYLQVEECFLEARHVCECGVARDMVQYGQRR
jgi:hypothetical protein